MEHGLTPMGGLTQPHKAGQTEPSFRADRYHQKLPSQEQHQFLSPTHSIYSHRHQNHKDPSCVWHIESIYATSPDFSPRFQLLLAPPEYLLPSKDSQGHKRDSPSGDTQKAQCLVRSQPQTQAPSLHQHWEPGQLTWGHYKHLKSINTQHNSLHVSSKYLIAIKMVTLHWILTFPWTVNPVRAGTVSGLCHHCFPITWCR